MQSQINNSALIAELASIYEMFVESNIFPVSQALEIQGKYNLDSSEKQDKAVREFANNNRIDRSNLGDFHKMFTNGYGIISQFDSLIADNNLKVSNAVKEQYEYIDQVIKLNEKIEQLEKEKVQIPAKTPIFPFIRRFNPESRAVETTRYQAVAPLAAAPAAPVAPATQALELALKQKDEKIAALESQVLVYKLDAEERGEVIYENEQLIAKLQKDVGNNNDVLRLENELKKQADKIDYLNSAALVYKNEALERGELIFENEHLIAALQKETEHKADSTVVNKLQERIVTQANTIQGLFKTTDDLKKSLYEKEQQIEKIKLQFEAIIARYA
jgi:hypothetical protein